MMKPTPTTCIAMSLPMPNEAQATGISSREPPATPEAPQAPMVETRQSSSAVGRSTLMPSVCAAARESTAIVMAAPLMLIVAPSGMEMEYVSSSRPRRSQRSRFTGMLAAELRVKKA